MPLEQSLNQFGLDINQALQEVRFTQRNLAARLARVGASREPVIQAFALRRGRELQLVQGPLLAKILILTVATSLPAQNRRIIHCQLWRMQ